MKPLIKIRWMLRPVANCCKGSQMTRVAPASRGKYVMKLIREYYELCDGGVCQDLLTEAERREVQAGTAMYLTGLMQEAENKLVCEAFGGNEKKVKRSNSGKVRSKSKVNTAGGNFVKQLKALERT